MQLQGILRVSAARIITPRPFIRLLSVSSARPLARSPFTFPQKYTLASLPSSRRFISLGSIFSRPKSDPTPTPHVVALITRLEAEANVHPHDVSKQLALFQALLDTKLPSSYDLIVNRWERMCEFVSPFLYMYFCSSFKYLERRTLHHHCCNLQKLSKCIF